MRRFLKRNKGTEAPSNFLFFDTESMKPHYSPDGWKRCHKMRLWVAIACRVERGRVTRRHVEQGTDRESFWSFVETRQQNNRPLWCVAHNLGYDWTQLDFWAELWKGRFTLGPLGDGIDPETGRKRRQWKGVLCAEPTPTFCICRGVHGVCKFTDTHNYWPMGLERLGNAFGLDKLPMPRWEAPIGDWFQYCTRDVEVLERAFLALIDRWVTEDCGVFQLTGPMLALTNYRHTATCTTESGKAVNIVLDPEAESIPLEREAYLGGRIECFYVGEVGQKVYHLDCNSLYPAMMSAEAFPRDRVRVGIVRTPDELRDVCAAYGAVAKVRINARGNTYPVRRDGVQFHATGIFDTVLAGPELKRALNAGDVERIGDVQVYSLAWLFRGWVDTWYHRKLAAIDAGEQGQADLEFCQLILRSLSAKWAQSGRYWSDRLDLGWQASWDVWGQYDRDRGRTRWYRSVAGVAQELAVDSIPRHCFPAISAFITSHAREFMRGVMRQMPPRSVYYTNTDSLVVSEKGYRHLLKSELVDDRKLGYFRLKGSYASAEFVGLNCYRLGDQWTRAGLHGSAKEMEGKGLVSEAWQSLASILRQYPDGEVWVEEHPFQEAESRVKGKLGADGWVNPAWLTPDSDWTDHLTRRLPPEPACRTPL